MQSILHLLGILTGGEVETAARDRGGVTMPSDALAAWASEQCKLLEEADLPPEQKAQSAEIIVQCGGTIGTLPVAFSGTVWLNLEELRPLIASKQKIPVYMGKITYEEDTDPVGRMEFDNEFKPSQELIIVPELSEVFIYPVLFRPNHGPSCLLDVFEDLLRTVWGGFEESEDYEYRVGSIWGVEILRLVTIYSRANPES